MSDQLSITTRLLALFLLLVVLAADAFSQEPASLEPQQGLVLLRNGQVLAGKIARTGDRYLVWLPDGEIRLSADQVDLVCRNMEDGYRKKRERIELGRSEDRIRLAEWCIEHKLWDYADIELKVAATLEANHPRLKLLARRLELGRNPPQAPAPAVEATPLDAGPSATDLDRLVREMPEGTVETFTQKIQPLLVNHCSAAACHGPRSETRLSFLRSTQQQVPNRRLTQRNLYSALQWIDADRLEASPLLTLPLSAHGGAKTPVFANNEAWQYQQLVHWASNVTRGKAVRLEKSSLPASPDTALKPAAAPPTLVPPVQGPAQPGATGRVRQASVEGEDGAGVVPAAFEQPVDEPSPPEGASPAPPRSGMPARSPVGIPRGSVIEKPVKSPLNSGIPKAGQLPGAADPFGTPRPSPSERIFPTIHDLPQRSEAKRGEAEPSSYEPADAFDPDVFNRRFFGRR